MIKKLPRGIRNNNPFNIKKSAVVWLGECKGDDKVFETFSSLEYGVRAGLKLLANYICYGYDTPRKILNRFAPFTENDTESYISFICDNPFTSADTPIVVGSPDYFSLCLAIIKYENGFDNLQLFQYSLDSACIQSIYNKYFCSTFK